MSMKELKRETREDQESPEEAGKERTTGSQRKEMSTDEKKMSVLSIDAWRDSEGGWTWNEWFKRGSISQEDYDLLDTPRKILKWLRKEGILAEGTAGLVSVEDDHYNMVVVWKGTREPIFAIAYGSFTRRSNG